MLLKKRPAGTLVCIFFFLLSSCANTSRIAQPQFSYWHYTFSVLLDPAQPGSSPHLDLGLSLLFMNFPSEQSRFLNSVLYSDDSLEAYKDRVLQHQRESFRGRLPADGINGEDTQFSSANWRYTERLSIKHSFAKALIIERDIESYSGGAHGFYSKRYHVLDMEELKQIRIDDLFQDYQGARTRAVIYEELRRFNGLEPNQPLSEGIFMSDAPELSFNFNLTQEGIAFRWDPYEISPYSEGGIEITVPWRRIRPLLLHSGMELLTKFDIYLFV